MTQLDLSSATTIIVMVQRRLRLLAFIVCALCFVPRAAFANYLGSWTLYDFPGGYSGFQGLGLTGIRLRIAFGPTASYCCGPDLFENSELTSSDNGHPLVADLGTDADFSAIAAQLTNGSANDQVSVYYLMLPSLEGGGAPWNEAYWASRPGSTAPADFSGYHLDRIELVPEYIYWTSPGHDSNGDGMYTDYFTDGRLDFYGSLIPEPSTALLIVLGLPPLFRRRRRKSVPHNRV